MKKIPTNITTKPEKRIRNVNKSKSLSILNEELETKTNRAQKSQSTRKTRLHLEPK